MNALEEKFIESGEVGFLGAIQLSSIAAAHYRKLAEREKVLTEALEKAVYHLSSIGYPVDENGQYKPGGTNWSFAEAVPKKADSAEVLAAYEVIEAALALHKE